MPMKVKPYKQDSDVWNFANLSGQGFKAHTFQYLSSTASKQKDRPLIHNPRKPFRNLKTQPKCHKDTTREGNPIEGWASSMETNYDLVEDSFAR